MLRYKDAIHHEYPESHEFSNGMIRVIRAVRVKVQGCNSPRIFRISRIQQWNDSCNSCDSCSVSSMTFTTNFPNLTNSVNVQFVRLVRFVLRRKDAIHHEYLESHEFSNVTIRVIRAVRVKVQGCNSPRISRISRIQEWNDSCNSCDSC